jgi:hypothetical protein
MRATKTTKRTMTLEEEERLYGYIEGKHCALDEQRDGGFFYMNMQMWFSGNRNIWRSFREGYLEHTKGRKPRTFDESWRKVPRVRPPPVGSF